MFKTLGIICLSLWLCACAAFVPSARNVQDPHWQSVSLQQDFQVDFHARGQSVSFILLQQQQAQLLQLQALSLTGQPLFLGEFDGSEIVVRQRLEAMRYLPLTFLLRDIMLATISHYQPENAQKVTVGDSEIITIDDDKVLRLTRTDKQIAVENLQAPYQMQLIPLNHSAGGDDE